MKKTTVVVACATLLFPMMNLAADDARDTREQKERDLAGLAAALDAGAVRRQTIRLALNDFDARQKALNFLGSQQAHRDAIASLQQCQSCHGNIGANALLDIAGITAMQPQGPWIGISVGPADGVLRSQLRLPEGTGVIVTQVVPNGPAQQSGVEEHDVLLSVNGKPVAGGEDLDKILQSATPGGPPLTLKLLRRGRPVEKQVAPRKSDPNEWLSNFVRHPEPTFRIGAQVSDPDETLKRQLNLTHGGVVVTEVAGGKPADAAGVKSGDVLLSVNRAPVAGHEELPEKIQAAGGSPVELELMRGGVTLKITVTPVKEDANADLTAAYVQFLNRAADPTRELMLVHPQDVDVLTGASRPTEQSPTTRPGSAAEQLRRISEQMEQLRRDVSALQAELAKQPDAKPAE